MTAVPPPGSPAAVTVLVCSRGRPRFLRDAVQSVLSRSTLPAELLIVDQSDAPDEKLAATPASRGCDVRYVHSHTVGVSRARNIGLREATHDIVALLDDDMLVSEVWLEALLTAVSDDSRVVATGPVLAAPSERLGGVVPQSALVTRTASATYRGPQALDVVPGANIALSRSLALAVGGFDERLGPGTRFGAADDNDMGHRLLRAGCEVRHVPDAVVFHRAWRSPRELVALRWHYGRGKGAFYAKHVAAGDRHIARRAAADAGSRLRRATMAAIGSPRGAVAELLSLAGMASGALEWVAREHGRSDHPA